MDDSSLPSPVASGLLFSLRAATGRRVTLEKTRIEEGERWNRALAPRESAERAKRGSRKQPAGRTSESASFGSRRPTCWPLFFTFLLLSLPQALSWLSTSFSEFDFEGKKKKKETRSKFSTSTKLKNSLSTHQQTEPSLTASAADRLGANFHAAPSGVTCDAACASFAGGLSALAFNEFGETTTGRTALCSALRKDGTRAAGFQILGGNGGQPTCTIADGSAAIEATEYACACIDSAKQVQGLQRPNFGAACSSTCATSLLGDSGRPVAVGAGAAAKGDHACLALNEQGAGNRFGSETAPGACVGGRDGGVAFGTDSFSCVCVYDRPAAKAAGPKTSSGKGVDATGSVVAEKRTFDKELVKPDVVSVASATAAATVDDP